jgi:type II secretory pathway pseudopilin PulG
MRAGRRIDATGLTLIEFLIATSIMAFAALGVAGMFPAAFRSVVAGGQVTKATILAQEMLNAIRNEPFDIVYLSPSSGNCYWGYSGFDTRNSLPGSCTSGTGSPESLNNKKKWKNDLLGGGAQTGGGRGLPLGYGTVAVTCLNVSPSSPYTLTTGTCSSANLLRVTVTVFWDQNASRSVPLVTYVARSE